ncbi:arsenic efflux protein [bacterium]|nr:arsenic efflux protein [bacterium]
MLVSIIDKINSLNEWMFEPIDSLIEKLPFADWVVDAICDSVHLLPFLFIVFLIIELLEFYYADKINSSLKKTGKSGVLVGSLASIIPQCGFSVIASSLYSKRIITRGALIAVYLATSDETIPILLATPTKAHLIIPIVGLKLLIGIVFGYLIDVISPTKVVDNEDYTPDIMEEEGCCKHDIEHGHKREIFIHPIVHTANVFGFILVITLILNYCLENVTVTNIIEGSKFIQPIIAGFVGLIPNCAISIGITMMLIKGSITFGAAMSGLLANAGLGLLVLLKNNDFKDTVKVISIVLVISILSGLCITFLS